MDLSEIVIECQNKSMAKAGEEMAEDNVCWKTGRSCRIVKLLLHCPFNGIVCKYRETLLDSISLLSKRKFKFESVFCCFLIIIKLLQFHQFFYHLIKAAF